jgi:hypothetical protein
MSHYYSRSDKSKAKLSLDGILKEPFSEYLHRLAAGDLLCL